MTGKMRLCIGAALVLTAGCVIAGLTRTRSIESSKTWYGSGDAKAQETVAEDANEQEPEETWFDQEESEEDFDFGLDEYWIDLNDLEYTVKDKLKCYLFIGTDHSGNEHADDETYLGSMADFLLLAILNKTENTYGFIQFNRDTITDVIMLDVDGEYQGVSEEQLCIAHWYGGSKQQSCINTVDTVSDLLGGLDIDGYYALSMDAIEQINHMLGGVTVTIEDDFSKVDPSLEMGKKIRLSDEQAVHYLQGRMNVGDGENESRMRRQRTYMEAVYDRVIDQVKADKDLLEDFTDALGDKVTTNMNGEDFAQFRDLFRSGESCGIYVPEGESMLGTKLDDGLEHTEFYLDEESLEDIMVTLCGLEIDEFSDWDDLETETEFWEEYI